MLCVVLLGLNFGSNRISQREIDTQAERVQELEGRVFTDMQEHLLAWEIAEINSIVVKYEELIRNELSRFQEMIRQESGFNAEFTTREEYQKTFYEYVAQRNKEFTDFMNEERCYVISAEKEEWDNLGTGGPIYLQFSNDNGHWALSYEGKEISEGRKISVAVYDRNGLFIERCEFTVDGKYEKVTRVKTDLEYQRDQMMAGQKYANNLISYMNTPNPTLMDHISFGISQGSTLNVSKTTSYVEWHTQNVSGKIDLTRVSEIGVEPIYYSIRVLNPDFSHKIKNGWDWTTKGGLL